MLDGRNPTLLTLFVLLHGIAGVLISFGAFRLVGDRDADVILVLGTCFAQTTLCAYWGSLCRSPFAWRWPSSALLVIVASLTVNLSFSLADGFLLIPAGMLIQWLAIQAPCWTLRLKFGWRVSLAEVDQPPTGYETQFGIKHLLAWTAAVGLLCAAIRGLSSVAAWGASTGDIGGLSLFVAFNTLLSIPPLWAALSRHAVLGWLALTLAYTLAVAWFEQLVFAALDGGGRPYWYLFASLNLVQLAWLLVSLWLVRWAGYRLVRSGSPASPVAS